MYFHANQFLADNGSKENDVFFRRVILQMVEGPFDESLRREILNFCIASADKEQFGPILELAERLAGACKSLDKSQSESVYMSRLYFDMAMTCKNHKGVVARLIQLTGDQLTFDYASHTRETFEILKLFATEFAASHPGLTQLAINMLCDSYKSKYGHKFDEVLLQLALELPLDPNPLAQYAANALFLKLRDDVNLDKLAMRRMAQRLLNHADEYLRENLVEFIDLEEID